MIKRWLKRLARKVGLHDGLVLQGNVELVVYGKDGKIKDYRYLENIITDVGCAWIADAMSDRGEGMMKYLAVGTGTTAPAGGDTKLGAEKARVSCGTGVQGTGANDHKVVYTGTIAAGTGTGALAEAGLLNAATAGDLMARLTYSVINKGTADTLAITWTISVADDGV